ncbi:GNAT family N-acetyltransferase [Macrococcus carouselicus]|nr:GNAT family N-acetyltransferase [Macrococcus carouselicus]
MEFRKLTEADETAFMDYYNEWPVPDEMVPSATNYSRYNRFDDFLSGLNQRESGEDWVTNTTFFYFVGGRIVGAGNIRHYLNEALLQTGGHVGYGVRPSERNKGYALAILRTSLEYLKTLNVERALVTCDEDNPASAKVIIKAGGREGERYRQDDGMEVRRFWIELK